MCQSRQGGIRTLSKQLTQILIVSLLCLDFVKTHFFTVILESQRIRSDQTWDDSSEASKMDKLSNRLRLSRSQSMGVGGGLGGGDKIGMAAAAARRNVQA